MTHRPWYVRWLRALGRWVGELAGDDYDRALPRTLDEYRANNPTRSE